MTNWISAFLRKALGQFGYVLIKKDYARFGYSLPADIKRISRVWDWSIDVVFDIGANVGQFAGEALSDIPDARIYSFEPFPNSFEKLAVSHTGPRFSPHNLAMCDKIGPVEFYVYGESGDASQINSLVPDAQFPKKFGFTSQKIEVDGSTVDAFCTSHSIKRIDLLKIDTEGSELQVLKGAENLLRAGSVRFVFVEFNTFIPKVGNTGGALLPIAEYLRKFGYEYMVTYTDYVQQDRQLWVNANALFARPPESGLSTGN